MTRKKTLSERYTPSEPCSCSTCLAYCKRPGWWTVKQAEAAMEAGHGNRMMLEMSPDRSFGVLSPAFEGCETSFATDFYSANGCTFLQNGLCELFGTGVQPLECRFCHHSRPGLGPKCHADLEKDWDTPAGQALVEKWGGLTGFKEYITFLQSG